MTKRLTISVPDDVAAVLELQDNVSAYVTDVVRRQRSRDRHDEAMRAVGLDPAALRTPEAKARARAALYVSPESAAGRRELARKLAAGEPDAR